MINVQLTVINVQRYNSTFNTQHSNLHCRAKKMYEAFSISHEQSQACLNFAMARKSMKILNKQVIFLISQYIGTCKRDYTKGYALN